MNLNFKTVTCSLCSCFIMWSCSLASAQAGGVKEDKQEVNYLNSMSGITIPRTKSLDIESREVRLKKINNQDIVSAIGDVVVHYGPYIIITQKLSLNKETQDITVNQRVLLLDEKGNTASAQYASFSPERSEGLLKGVDVRLREGRALISADAIKLKDSDVEITNASYTTCKICRFDENPLWRVRAKTIEHREKEQINVYKHAFLEVLGVPIFYFPYFVQNDVSVKRASGFLTPSFSQNTHFGQSVRIPYYWSIAPNMDTTIMPTIYTQENPLFLGEFRHRLSKGAYIIKGGLSRTSQQMADTPTDLLLRGYIFSNGLYQLENNWRSSFQINLTSDSTFLERYGIDRDKTVLVNNFHLDRIEKDETLRIDAFSFQSLQYPDELESNTIVSPRVYYNKTWKSPQSIPGNIGLNMSTASVGKPSLGLSSSRLSSKLSWEDKLRLPMGQLLNLSGELRGDAYLVHNTVADTPVASREAWLGTGRFLPTVAAQWSYPIFTTGFNLYHVIEPIAHLYVSPVNASDKRTIPNEDSRYVEFDDTNVFSQSRFPGEDRVESGTRANYGILYTVYNSLGYQGSFLFGQMHYFTKKEGVFPEYSGLAEQTSDYVGHISFSTDLFYVFNNFRLKKKDFGLQRYELGLGTSYQPLELSLSYSYFVGEREENLKERSEVAATGSLAFLKNWRIKGGLTYDFKAHQSISKGVGFIFQNECLFTEFTVSRRDVTRLDVLPETSYVLQFKLTGINA